MLGVIVGEGMLGVVASVIGTWFDIRECTDFVGGGGNSSEKFEIRDLFDMTLCGLSREALRSDGMFCKLLILFE